LKGETQFCYNSRVLADLKLAAKYDGLLYLAEATRYLPQIQSHHHAEVELNVVVQGTITYVMNGHRYTFSPRTLLWLFPQNEHQLVDRSDDARFYVAAFKQSLINRSCHSEIYEDLKRGPEAQDRILSAPLDPKAFESICNVLDFLMHGAPEADVLNREAGYGPTSNFRFEHSSPDILNAGLRYVLLLCWSCQLKSKETRDAIALHPAVRRALKLLGEPGAKQDLETLARFSGTSVSFLSRKFHMQIGVPLNRYRNSLRLSRFFEVYQQSDQITLAEAVYAAGFGSYAQFYKVFTQAYGCGPRDRLVRKFDKK
jgi:AraC-like DNA-binding protein